MRNDAPVMVTGLGGSGTRTIAAILAAHGLYLGDCFNPALDNLWLHFLLFNRTPFGSSEDVRPMVELFARRMRSPSNWDDGAVASVLEQKQRLESSGIDFGAHRNLALGCNSLLMKPGKSASNTAGQWGFKYPPGYLYAPFLFEAFPGARMVFLVRHPLDMAFSPNLNQLRRFGHWLGPEVKLTPRWQLKHWLKAHDHVTSLAKRYAIQSVGFEAMVSQPADTLSDLFRFLGLGFNPTTLNLVQPQRSTGRFHAHSLSQFDREDLDRVKDMGFLTNGE